MDYRIGTDDRAAYKTCRRRWDLGGANRSNLEPVGATTGLAGALEHALAVYYFPGMWDWASQIVLPQVARSLTESLADPTAATALLEAYATAAPELDDFAPVKINHEADALVPEPDDPERGLLTVDGGRVWYTAQIDLLAVDAADEYWMVTHRIAEDWANTESLVLDEQAVTACWAWEQSYIGFRIAGTVHNELRTAAGPASPSIPPDQWPARGGIPQNEPSGGGRSIPQHRRRSAHPAGSADPIQQASVGPVRRTRIRRTRAEIEAAGLRLGSEAREMTGPGLAVYPAPSAAHCGDCPFVEPCLLMSRGDDPSAVLAANYRQRTADKPRLGATSWAMGRGTGSPWARQAR